jgi:PRC-barrel domain protein
MHRLGLVVFTILAPTILLPDLGCAAPPPAEVIDPDQVLSLLDSKVQRQDDKVIGRIINVFIDNAAPRRAIVKLDGFMGVGTHTAVVPWDSLHFDAKADTVSVVADLGPDQIRAMAKLKPSAATIPRAEPQAEPAPPERGLKLIDATLNGPDDKALGRVTDLLVDRSGQPRAIVVALGGTLDPKGRQIAVSWHAIHFVQSQDGPILTAAITDEQAKAAGAYETGKPLDAILPPPPSPLSGDQPAARPR